MPAPVRLTLNVPLITAILVERNWTRARLARELGYDPSTITYHLSGRTVELSGAAVLAYQRLFPEYRDELFIDHREATIKTEIVVAAGDEVGV